MGLSRVLFNLCEHDRDEFLQVNAAPAGPSGALSPRSPYFDLSRLDDLDSQGRPIIEQQRFSSQFPMNTHKHNRTCSSDHSCANDSIATLKLS